MWDLLTERLSQLLRWGSQERRRPREDLPVLLFFTFWSNLSYEACISHAKSRHGFFYDITVVVRDTVELGLLLILLIVRAVRAMLRADWVLTTEDGSRALPLQEGFREKALRRVEVAYLLLVIVLRETLVLIRQCFCDWSMLLDTVWHSFSRWLFTLDALALHGGLVACQCLLGQSLDKLGLLEEVDNLWLEHAAQLFRCRLRQAHTFEQVVLVRKRKLTICW